MANDKKALHVQVAEKLIEQLKAGTAPWQKPWNANGVPAFELPFNAVTGNRYKGINTFSLLLGGFDDPRWLTFKQAAANDWQVRKGEKGTPIQFVKVTDRITKTDENGKPVLDENKKPIKITVKRDKPVITNAWVFNASQVDGIPELKKAGELGWSPIERAENLIAATKSVIVHKLGDNAHYNPFFDQITMPLREQFDEAAKYYATILHELGHWTGHKERLDRSLINTFGSETYAREELRAEIASMLLGQELRIGHDPGQHVAYVDDWISVLEDNPFEIHSAAADAEKIFNYLVGFERNREIRHQDGAVDLHATVPEESPKYLTIGDAITYNDTIYKVLGHLKQGRLRIEESGSGQVFILSRADNLYHSLTEAKNENASPQTNIRETKADVEHQAEINAKHYVRR
mgnify:CR=1 FL=1